MKKIILTLIVSLFAINIFSQPPMRRQLPNQFRDYIDFRKSQEKPTIEHKDGKVIITMSEESFRVMQYRRMQMARMNRRHVPGHRWGNAPMFERHQYGNLPNRTQRNIEERWERTRPQK